MQKIRSLTITDRLYDSDKLWLYIFERFTEGKKKCYFDVSQMV